MCMMYLICDTIINYYLLTYLLTYIRVQCHFILCPVFGPEYRLLFLRAFLVGNAQSFNFPPVWSGKNSVSHQIKQQQH